MITKRFGGSIKPYVFMSEQVSRYQAGLYCLGWFWGSWSHRGEVGLVRPLGSTLLWQMCAQRNIPKPSGAWECHISKFGLQRGILLIWSTLEAWRQAALWRGKVLIVCTSSSSSSSVPTRTPKMPLWGVMYVRTWHLYCAKLCRGTQAKPVKQNHSWLMKLLSASLGLVCTAPQSEAFIFCMRLCICIGLCNCACSFKTD